MPQLTTCPACEPKRYVDIIKHVQKNHNVIVSQQHNLQFNALGLYQCKCLRWVKGRQGLQRHLSYAQKDPVHEHTTVREFDHRNRPSAGSRSIGSAGPPAGLLEGSDTESETSDHPIPGPRRHIYDSLSEASDASSEASLVDPPVPETWFDLVSSNSDDAFLGLTILPSTKAELSTAVAIEFKATCERMVRQYHDDPSLTNLLLILGIPKQGLAPGYTRLSVGNCRRRLRAYPQVDLLDADSHDRGHNGGPLETAVHHHLQQREVKAASRLVRGAAGIAPQTAETIEKLKQLHPEGPVNPFGDYVGQPPPPLDRAKLRDSVHRLPHDVGAGVSGWTAPLLKLACKSAEFSSWLYLLGNQIAQGTAPGARFLCAARLLPFVKPNSEKVRPIAVGELFYRVIAKALFTQHFSVSQLHTNQLGVGSKLGVEPIIRLAETEIIEPEEAEGNLLDLDAKNAFNNMDRKAIATGVRKYSPMMFRATKWAYNEPSPLYVVQGKEVTIIPSSQGARQGDPLGPYLFSLALRDDFTHIHDNIVGPSGYSTAYLDDIKCLIKTPETCQQVLDYVTSDDVKSRLNFHLNLEKTEITPFRPIREEGTEMLGSFIGPTEKRREFLKAKIDKVIAYLPRLKELSRQDGLLLLRECHSRDLLHLLRTLDCSDIAEEWNRLDAALEGIVDFYRGAGTAVTEEEASREITKLLYHLPVKLGGVGLPSHRDTLEAARKGYQVASAQFLEARNLPCDDIDEDDKGIKQRDLMNDVHNEKYWALQSHLNPYQLSVFQDQVNRINGAWMVVCPTTPKLTVTDQEVSRGLRQRTLVPVHAGSPLCLTCGQAMQLNHEEACRGSVNRRTYRHNALRDLIVDQIRKGCHTGDQQDISVEPLVAEEGSDDRVDLEIVGSLPVNGSGASYDLAVIALTNRKFTDSPAAVKEQQVMPIGDNEDPDVDRSYKPKAVTNHWIATKVSEKIRKYEGRTRYLFLPLVITTGGTMNTYFKDLIKTMLQESRRPYRSEISVLLLKYSSKLLRPRNR